MERAALSGARPRHSRRRRKGAAGDGQAGFGRASVRLYRRRAGCGSNCRVCGRTRPGRTEAGRQTMTAGEDRDDGFAVQRRAMLDRVARHAGRAAGRTGRAAISGPVMQAVARVPRHAFVPAEMAPYAYLDRPLPIGCGKTVSQPFIVALMTDLLEVGPEHRVLEIGTGLGYQTAVLAELAAEIFTVEAIGELAEGARRRLAGQGYANVSFRTGDGNLGWAAHAPFDRILVTAAPELIPPALLEQLRPGGRMAIPAGLEEDQRLLLVTRDAGGRFGTEEILPVRFSRLMSGAEAARERG